MSLTIETLVNAQKSAMATRPKVGGFPLFAESLRQSGVLRNVWSLPSCQSLYVTKLGPVVQQGTPLVTGVHEVAKFDREALIVALRTDQAGQGTFPEFLQRAWAAGVVGYEVDFEARKVTYFGALGDSYVEDYPAVTFG